jgi:hypothetical protein
MNTTYNALIVPAHLTQPVRIENRGHGHGSPGRRGDESDAPGHLIRLAEQLFDVPLAA